MTTPERSRRVYGEDMISWSREIFADLPAKPTDAELAQATHKLYRRVMATADWQQEFREGQKTLDLVQRTLGCYTIDLADQDLQQRFATRRGMVSVEVLPKQFLGEAYELRAQGAGWRLPELLVPVPVHWMRHGEHFRLLPDLHCLSVDLPYDAGFGLMDPEQ